MKRLYPALLLVCVLYLAVTPEASAQFVKGYGITIGITKCKQIWRYHDTDEMRKTKNKFGLNGSFFLEMLNHDNIRWISELQYNRKGAKEKPPEGGKFRNRVNYFSWNNFLKLREEGYTTVPYILLGPRLEYKFNTNPQIYNDTINDFKKFHVSFSVGAGMEFLFLDPWVLFVEFHYNPDVTNAYRNKGLNDLAIKHRAYELRVGIKKLIYNREACP